MLVTQTSFAGKPGGHCKMFAVFFFVGLFNVKNNFDIQLEYVDLRDSVKQARLNTRQNK